MVITVDIVALETNKQIDTDNREKTLLRCSWRGGGAEVVAAADSISAVTCYNREGMHI